jgi:hypothetical protein
MTLPGRDNARESFLQFWNAKLLIRRREAPKTKMVSGVVDDHEIRNVQGANNITTKSR